jgi:16S rRNA (adenine(1408)-N(1))-methyltransferase
VVGLDAAKEPLAEVSRRAAKRPERGGLPNLIFGWASAQQPPEELTGRADELHVTMPWGSLLEGLALGRPEVLTGLARLARPGARLRVVVNGAAWEDNAPARLRHLPQLTPDYVRSVLAGRYGAHGIQVGEIRALTGGEIDALHSTWAKRLRAGGEYPHLTLIDARVDQGVEATPPRTEATPPPRTDEFLSAPWSQHASAGP